MNNSSEVTSKNGNAIRVKQIISFSEALDLLPNDHPLRGLRPSQLDKLQKQSIALRFLPDGIGIDGHEYDKGVKAVLAAAADQSQSSAQNSDTFLKRHEALRSVERTHVYRTLM